MKKYQTEGERELNSEATAELFRGKRYEVRCDVYDFGSSPLAGMLPGWRLGCSMARWADDLLLRAPALKKIGSNFEIVTRKA